MTLLNDNQPDGIFTIHLVDDNGEVEVWSSTGLTFTDGQTISLNIPIDMGPCGALLLFRAPTGGTGTGASLVYQLSRT